LVGLIKRDFIPGVIIVIKEIDSKSKEGQKIWIVVRYKSILKKYCRKINNMLFCAD